MTSGYDAVAGVYDLLADLYGLGLIRACKRSQLTAVRPGDRVLFAGAGSGGEALEAARKGARVTVVDLSPRMLSRARDRFRKAGLDSSVELILGDVREHVREPGYDVVAAQFFLNVFPEPGMEEMLSHLAGLVRPGGCLLIADFAPAGENALAGALRRFYFGIAVLAFRVLAGNPVHALYDYAGLLPGAGLRLVERQGFRPLGLGPELFMTLKAVRVDMREGDCSPNYRTRSLHLRSIRLRLLLRNRTRRRSIRPGAPRRPRGRLRPFPPGCGGAPS